MKTSTLLILIFASVTLNAADSADLQTWTYSNGRVIRAKVITVTGDAVVFEVNGRRVKTPFFSLTPASVALAKEVGGGGSPSAVPNPEAAVPAAPASPPAIPETNRKVVAADSAEWDKRHREVLALIENVKKPEPTKPAVPKQSHPYRDFSNSPKTLTHVSGAFPSLTVVGEVDSFFEGENVRRAATDAMTSEAVLIGSQGLLMSTRGTVNLERELGSFLQQKTSSFDIQASRFFGNDLFILCYNRADQSHHAFRYSGKLEYCCNLTRRLRDFGIDSMINANAYFSCTKGSPPNGEIAFWEVAFFADGYSRLVHVSPKGCQTLAFATKGSGELYTEQGEKVGRCGDEEFPSVHPDGTVSTITERLFSAKNHPPQQGLVFFKEGRVDRISPQEIAAAVLGADGQPRSVTTPSGGKADLSWEMTVHAKNVGPNGQLYLLLKAKYDRANPAGLVTVQESWHIAAVDGRNVIPLFHSGEQPGLSLTVEEVYAIHPQPDGSVYLRIWTGHDVLLGRIVGGMFRVLLSERTQYADESGRTCSVRVDSSRPFMAHNSRFLVFRYSKGSELYVICEDADLTPLAKAAEAGDLEAMTLLAGRCLRGDGVQKDSAQAIRLYEKAAALGGADAMFELGFCHAEGVGMEKDEKKAADWFLKAANQGHALAMYNLGVCHENGRGLPKDVGLAFDWYIRAAQQDLPNAFFILAVSYDTGIAGLVPQDARLARALCLRAAQLGSADAAKVLEKQKREWTQNALSSAARDIQKAQDDAAERARIKMRDWSEQQAGRAGAMGLRPGFYAR